MQSQPSSSSSPSASSFANQSIDPSPTPTSSNQASSESNPLLPSITTSTPNKKTFSILSSNNAPSTLPINKNPKRSLSSHQALLRSGPKVSSASAIGVGAKISSYGVNQKIGLTSPSSEEGSLNLVNDSSGASGSERDSSGATERLEGLQDGGSIDESRFLPEASSIFSPGIDSGELDRRLELTEEHQRAIAAPSSRPEFNKRNSSSNSSTSGSNQSSISPTTLIRPSAPSMLRTNTNGSASTASLSPMSERSFCLSDGGGSCESAITTPGPSPFRKDFNLENDGGDEIEIEKSVHQRERSYTYSEPSGLFNEKSIQHSGRSSEPNGGYSRSNSSGETTTGSKIINLKSFNGSSSSNAISRAGSLRSSHSGSGRNSNSSLSSYPRHVRRSTFGRDSTTGKWLYSPTSTPISSRSASANISNIFKQDHPKVEKEIPGVEENETSTQVHHFALPLPERAPLNLEADNKKSKGTWRNSFNWETSGGGGGGGDQSWNQDGEISPKKVTFGQREINQPTRNVEKIKAFNGKSFEEWLGNEKEKDGNDASSEASNLRTQSLANPRLEEAGLLQPHTSRASSAPNVSFDLEASRMEDHREAGQLDSPPPLPPAYLRNSAGATRDSDLLKNPEQEGNQVESTQESREIQVEVSSSNLLTSSRGRAQSSPNSSQWSNQVKSGKDEESIPSSPPPLTSRHSIDVAQTAKIEPEVDVYHLPAVAIAARAVATVNVVQSPSIPSLNASSSTTAFSSTFPFMVALVPSTSTSDSRPSLAQQQLLRRRSERDVTNSRTKSNSNSSLRPNGTRSAFLASTPQKSTFLENEVITEEPSTLNKPVTPPRARAVSASSTFTGLDHSSPGSSPSFKSVGEVGSRSLIQASPRGKFTSKFKGGNLDLSARKKPRESQVRAAQSVNKEGSGNIVPKDVEVDTPMESLEDSFRNVKSEGKGDRTINQAFELIKPSSGITFSSFQVSADPTPRPSDLGDPFELDSKVDQLSSPTKSSFKPSSASSSESARHISARALASRLLTGENTIKSRSNHLLAVSNPRFAKAISASHDTDGEDSDGGYSSETPVPTPNAGTPLPIKDPIETAMSNGCAITPPLESSSAASTPVKSTFSLDAVRSLEEETIVEAQQSKRGSYPFGLTKPSTTSNPPSPLELPDLLCNSIPSFKSEDWSIKSRECLEALEMDSKGAEWGQVKLKALEKGWKRRTVAGILEASSSSPLQTASRIISTPSSILADAAKRQAEKSLLEGAKEARASNRHKTWAPERFGEELGNSARNGVGREFSREEARVAMNVGESLEAVAEEPKETSSSSSTSAASSSRGIQSPSRPPRPPKSALRMITSPNGIEKLLSNVTLDSSSSEAAAASEKKKRRSLPAQISSSSSPTTILTPIPRSARRPTFIHKESDSFSSTSNVVKRLEEANDEEESDFALGLGLKLDPFENSKSTPKPERKHSRIPSLVEDRESSLGNLKTSLSFSQSLASGLINPLHSPLAQAAVSNLNSPTSRSFSQAQLRQSILLASDVEKEMEKLEPYRVTPRPEGRDGMVGTKGEILPR